MAGVGPYPRKPLSAALADSQSLMHLQKSELLVLYKILRHQL